MGKFEEIHEECLASGRLYEDPEFRATSSSIYFSKRDPLIRWKRPSEIAQDPKFIVDGVTQFDLDQGAIGNCWFIAGAATLACHKELFQRVVPRDQGFGENYAGVFRFYFWRFGKVVEVIVDDRLPTKMGKLYFCNNREEPSEFWSALMEKAYAKLHGSYEALEGGWTEDAQVDFTGGIGSRIDLKSKKLPPNLFDMIVKFHGMSSMMGSCIFASRSTMENILPNGLVIGHAYSITGVVKGQINGKEEELIRLRNPWGQKEWNGAWSDKSREWKSVDPQTRKKMGLTLEENGEFWMSFKDWITNFEQMQVCHLPPENSLEGRKKWQSSQFDGKWVKGVSAGGSGNPPYASQYWTNPQYCITLRKSDVTSGDKVWLVVSLMQKHSRTLRTYLKTEMANLPISFDLYKVKSGAPTLLEGESYSRHALELTRRGHDYDYCRENSAPFTLDPGNYVVIPSTFQPNMQRGFLLRFFTERGAETRELDEETGPIMAPPAHTDQLRDLFQKYAGSDNAVDGGELQLILNEAFSQDMADSHSEFDLEASRSILCMMDRDQSGVLEYEELRKAWTELNTWRNVFRSFDKDQSGFINISELRTVFKSAGYSLGRSVVASIVRRYGGKEQRLTFNDFIVVMCKVITLIHTFSSRSSQGLKGKLDVSLGEFVELALSI